MRGYPSQPLALPHGEPEGESEGYAKMRKCGILFSIRTLPSPCCVREGGVSPRGGGVEILLDFCAIVCHNGVNKMKHDVL